MRAEERPTPIRPVRAALAQRWPTAVAITALALWWAGWAWWIRIWSGSPVEGLSWHFFADGGQWLVSGPGLHLYGEHPELQIGPLALLVPALLHPLGAGLAKGLTLAAMSLTGPALLLILGPAVTGSRVRLRLLLAAFALAPGWLLLSLRWGHLDDVIAMAAAVGAVRAVAAVRPLATGAWLAIAIAAKPWAIGFVPLALALPWTASGLLTAIGIAGAGTLLAWLPFLLADSRTLDALRPPVALVEHSGLYTLGARGETVPAWGRTVQFLLTLAGAALAGLRGRWPGVLLVAIAVRIATDAQDNAYYLGSAALAAVVFDLLGTRRLVPWSTLATTVLLWQPFTADYQQWRTATGGLTHFWFAHPGLVGAEHLLWAAAMVAVVLFSPAPARTDPESADRSTPDRRG